MSPLTDQLSAEFVLLPKSLTQLSNDQLGTLVDAFENNIITARAIKTHFQCTYKSFQNIVQLHLNRPLVCDRGRPLFQPTPEVIDAVKSYLNKFVTGYRRVADAWSRRGQLLTDHQAYMIFKVINIPVEEEDEKMKHPRRFMARYVNQLWHTDLHSLEKVEGSKRYLIAFIDDRSRKILHYEVLRDKIMKSTSTALTNCLTNNPKPHEITMDNGGEFIGQDFKKVMEDLNIKAHHINPREPQENGKIERWWGTFEKTMLKNRDIRLFVDEYNGFWAHNGLANTGYKNMTPNEA